MTVGTRPKCFDCKHLFEDETVEEIAGREGFRCVAFPDRGIPEDIFWGEFEHNKEHPDQEVPGIVFESKEEDTE